ncbi:MAG: hypothetical protein JWN46_107 [Acidimicrobiales bacterium]|nr:hypothetical protein [Acidimicrobiales bacterium]
MAERSVRFVATAVILAVITAGAVPIADPAWSSSTAVAAPTPAAVPSPQPDPTFGDQGTVTLTQPALSNVWAVSGLSDGRTALLWTDTPNGAAKITVLDEHGAVDPTFGTNGTAVTAIYIVSSQTNLIERSGGDICIVGSASGSDSSATGGVECLTPHGVPDSAFGLGGQVDVPGVLLRGATGPGGRLIVSNTTAVFVMAANGILAWSLDPITLGVQVALPSKPTVSVAAVGFDAEGRSYVAATTRPFQFTGNPVYAVRLTAAGEVDRTYGSGGSVEIGTVGAVQYTQDEMGPMVVATDGTLVAVNTEYRATLPDSSSSVAVVDAAGSVTTQLNEGGRALTSGSVAPTGALVLGSENDPTIAPANSLLVIPLTDPTGAATIDVTGSRGGGIGAPSAVVAGITVAGRPVAWFAGGVVRRWMPVAATAPGKPFAPVAIGDDRGAGVSWWTPLSGGSPLRGYVVTPYIGPVAQTAVTFASPATSQQLTGLVNGKPYRFTVEGRNDIGAGPPSPPSPIAIPPFSSPIAFVQQQARDVLGRSPTGTELLLAVAALNTGAEPSAYVTVLLRGADATFNVDPVARLYFAYLLRIPEQAGLAYWIGRKRTGTSLNAISNAFAASSEFKIRYGSLTNSQFVNLVYQNVLGRPGDPGGMAFWTGQLDQHKATRGQVMVAFSESSEYKYKKQPSVDVAVTWIDMLGASPDQTSFNAWVTNLTSGGKTVTDLASAVMAMPAYATRVG